MTPTRDWVPTLQAVERSYLAGNVKLESLVQRYERWRGSSVEFDEALERLKSVPYNADGLTMVGYTLTTMPRVSRFRPLSADPVLANLARIEVDTLFRSQALFVITPASLGLKGCVHTILAVYRSSTARDRARIIADLRVLNAAGPEPASFTLPSFADVEPTARWAIKLDLVAGFHSLRMAAQSARFTTARLNDQWVWWRGMPMGWSHAPIIFTRALDPLVMWLRSRGCRVLKYLDDFLVTGETREEVIRARDMLISELLDMKFAISTKKSVLEPTQQIVFLGMGIDLAAREFYWPADKAQSIVERAQSILELSREGRSCTKELQSFVGKTAFLCQVVPLAASWRRHLEKASTQSDSDSEYHLSDEARNELVWWSEAPTLLGGTRFPMEDATAPRFVIRGDASEHGFGLRIKGPDGPWTRIALMMPLWLRGESSGLREIYCSIAGLNIIAHRHGAGPLRGSRIDIFSDSTASVGAMRRGGKSTAMALATRLILSFSRKFAVVVDPHWLRREELAEEDNLSRACSSAAEAMVEQALIDRLADLLWGDSVAFDAFATSANTRADKFASRWYEVESETVDGVTARWPECTWAFPPFSLGRKVARRMATTGARSMALLESNIPAPPHIRQIPIRGMVRLWSPPLFNRVMRPPRELSLWVAGPTLPPHVRVCLVCCVSRVRACGTVVQIHDTMSTDSVESFASHVPGIDCDHDTLDPNHDSFPHLHVERFALPAAFRHLRTQGIEDVFIVASAQDMWHATRMQDAPRLTWAWTSGHRQVATTLSEHEP